MLKIIKNVNMLEEVLTVVGGEKITRISTRPAKSIGKKERNKQKSKIGWHECPNRCLVAKSWITKSPEHMKHARPEWPISLNSDY